MKNLLSVVFISLFTVAAFGQEISLTQYPNWGTTGLVSGVVTGSDPTQYKVVVIFEIDGTLWTKPSTGEPSIAVGSDGIFSVQLSDQEICTHQINAYLVPAEAEIPRLSGTNSVPMSIVGSQLASASYVRVHYPKAMYWIYWTWLLKQDALCETTPYNYSAQNVSVDQFGRLHLAICHTNGAWTSSGIYIQSATGYGRYTFFIDSDLSSLPPEAEFRQALYDPDPAENHREIAFSYSNGNVGGTWKYSNAWGGQSQTFVPKNGSVKANTLFWAPGVATFSSFTSPPLYSSQTFSGKFVISATSALGPGQTWDDNLLANCGLPSLTFILPGSTNYHWQSSLALPACFMRPKFQELSSACSSTPFEKWTVAEKVPAPDPDSWQSAKVHLDLRVDQSNPPKDTTKSYEVVLSKIEQINLSVWVANPLPSITLRNANFGTNTSMDIGIRVK